MTIFILLHPLLLESRGFSLPGLPQLIVFKVTCFNCTHLREMVSHFEAPRTYCRFNFSEKTNGVRHFPYEPKKVAMATQFYDARIYKLVHIESR